MPKNVLDVPKKVVSKIDPNIANAFTLILHGAQSIMTISAGIIGIIFFLYIKNK